MKLQREMVISPVTSLSFDTNVHIAPVYCSLVNKPVHVPTTRYIHPTYKWISGIPDGLIYDSASGTSPSTSLLFMLMLRPTGELDGILEIKCRFPRSTQTIETTVPYQTMTQIYYYIPQVAYPSCFIYFSVNHPDKPRYKATWRF